jgi:tight adherence protein B
MHRQSSVRFSRDDAAQLCGQLSALSRAGLAPARAWQTLAESRGPAREVATTVAGMLAVGGSAADGLALAAGQLRGPGVEALDWLAATSEVMERSGAPAAVVLDGVGEGLLAQIAQLDERDVALAGPKTTARVLGSLPIIGVLLGAAMGVNTLAVLLGTPLGWACGTVGTLLWVLGRRWSSRLVATAARVGT